MIHRELYLPIDAVDFWNMELSTSLRALWHSPTAIELHRPAFVQPDLINPKFGAEFLQFFFRHFEDMTVTNAEYIQSYLDKDFFGQASHQACARLRDSPFHLWVSGFCISTLSAVFSPSAALHQLRNRERTSSWRSPGQYRSTAPCRPGARKRLQASSVSQIVMEE